MNFGQLTQMIANMGNAAMPGAGFAAKRILGLFGDPAQSAPQTGGEAGTDFAAMLASLASANGSSAINPAAATSINGNIILPQTDAAQIHPALDGKDLSAALDQLALLTGAKTEDGAADLDKLATLLGVTPDQLKAFKAELAGGQTASDATGAAQSDPDQALEAETHKEDNRTADALAATLTPYLIVLAAVPNAAAEVPPAAAEDLAAAIRAATNPTMKAGTNTDTNTGTNVGTNADIGMKAGMDTASAPDENDMASSAGPSANDETADAKTGAQAGPDGHVKSGAQLAAALLKATAAAEQPTAQQAAAILAKAAKSPLPSGSDTAKTDPEAAPSDRARAMAAQTAATSNSAAERQIETPVAPKAVIGGENRRDGKPGDKTDSLTASGDTAENKTDTQKTTVSGKGDNGPGVATTAPASDKQAAPTAASEFALSLKGAFQTDSSSTADGEDGLGLNSLNGTSPLNLSNSSIISRPAMASPNWAPFGAYVAGQVAMQISRAVRDGANNFKIRLDPPELGRVDVKLEISHDGRINAVLAADNEKTLQLLQKEHAALERALQGAGLKTDSGSLNFSLNSQQNHGQQGNEDRLFARSGKIHADMTNLSGPAVPAATAVMQLSFSDRALDIQV